MLPEKPIIIVTFCCCYLRYLFRAAHRFLLVAVLGFLALVPLVEHERSTCVAWA